MARTKAAKPTTQTKVGTKRTKESGHTSSTKVEVAKKKQKVHEEEELSESENQPNKNRKKDKQKPKKAILTTQQLTQNEEAKDADAVLHKQLALFEFDREG